MRAYQFSSLLLTVACCLAAEVSLAQRTAVAPLAPRQVLAQPATTNPGVQFNTKWQVETQPVRQPSAITATVPAERHIRPEPIYLLNSHIIINGNGLAGVRPLDISDVIVYKVDAPVQWRSLLANGIIDIKLKTDIKPPLKTKSLATIRRQARVSGPVSFKLNSMRLEDSSLRIATKAIAGLDVLHDESGTVINIRLAPYQPAPRHDPPGTIYIRGVASR